MGGRNIIWAVTALAILAGPVAGACCYFAAQDKDINQPAQKAFITWDPEAKQESFTVQPKFEGDARDFGMVVPTPTRPKLDEMPRDFFANLAVYTILLPLPEQIWVQFEEVIYEKMAFSEGIGQSVYSMRKRGMGVRVLESGVVGSLDYKILTAERADGLYEWLEVNGYSYAGDESTLDHYIQKGWVFTVMKIDTKQMKKGAGGAYQGEVTPTRFAFKSDSLVYPLKITAISVRDSTEALFYVQAPEQMDLQGNWSWAWSYRLMWLTSGRVCISQKRLTPQESQEMQDRRKQIEEMRREVPGFDTTKLEWARRIGKADLEVIDSPLKHYRQMGLPDLPDDAKVVSLKSMKDELWAAGEERSPEAMKEAHARSVLAGLGTQYAPEKGVIVRVPPDQGKSGAVFWWFPHRKAPNDKVKALTQLKGHVRRGSFLTKFRKVFQKSEMQRDLKIVPADAALSTEYSESSPRALLSRQPEQFLIPSARACRGRSIASRLPLDKLRRYGRPLHSSFDRLRTNGSGKLGHSVVLDAGIHSGTNGEAPAPRRARCDRGCTCQLAKQATRTGDALWGLDRRTE